MWTMNVVVWFRRDLRLHDHGALAAAQGHDVVPLFVIDPRLWRGAGALRRSRLLVSLRSLDAEIRGAGGPGLVVRTGDPARVVVDAARGAGADHVLFSEDFGPYGRRRDAAVAAALRAAGAELAATDTAYLHAPGSIVTGGGSGYSVFTPYYRAWAARATPAPMDGVDTVFSGALATEEIPPPEVDVPGGEAHAADQLDSFAESGLDAYAAARNRPDLDSTSRLGAALHFGELHPRTVVARVGGVGGPAAAFVRQLCWRDFYADVLHRIPSATSQNINRRFDRMPWITGEAADDLFASWAAGQTGYPFVDAGMRQLAATGWMHNRVRMVVASFLTKDLLIHWNRGARWFLEHLLDADVANNALGWQWTAGTGTDAAPYFRVFNPVLQGLKFDPDGDYVRTFVPELRHLPAAAAHEPWRYPDGYAHGYARRIVDHAEARSEALRIYDGIKAAG